MCERTPTTIFAGEPAWPRAKMEILFCPEVRGTLAAAARRNSPRRVIDQGVNICVQGPTTKRWRRLRPIAVGAQTLYAPPYTQRSFTSGNWRPVLRACAGYPMRQASAIRRIGSVSPRRSLHPLLETPSAPYRSKQTASASIRGWEAKTGCPHGTWPCADVAGFRVAPEHRALVQRRPTFYSEDIHHV